MTKERIMNVALAGCGTVGSAVAEIVVNRGDELAARTGVRFRIVRALVADLNRDRSAPVDRSVFTSNVAEFNATPADLLVEVLGGTGTSREVVMAALQAGRPVVTANKALLALHGVEVFQTARRAGVCVAFEASCAGGLPIIGALLHGLTANRIDKLYGILNSTCHFIITQMMVNKASFAEALADAQRRGYAEADPTLDIAGGDTAHKLTILASLAFGLNIDFNRVVTEGIQQLQLDDLRIADELGYACKLLGVARRIYGDGDVAKSGRPARPSDLVSLEVHPMLVPKSHSLAVRSGTSSGVGVVGDAVDETFYAGAGAGGLPTASGVVADMVDVATGAAKATFEHLRIFSDRTPPARYADRLARCRA